MSAPSAGLAVDADHWDDQLLSHLRRLDRYQLEAFKLGLQCPQLLPESCPRIPWANLKAAGPTDLLCLLKESFPGQRAWAVTLRLSEDMKLTALCEELRAQMKEMAEDAQGPGEEEGEGGEGEGEPEAPQELSVHRGRYRVWLKARLLAMWDHTPWPEDHVYLRPFREQEHQELRRLLGPRGARTVVLHGPAGVGKTTLAVKVALHWAEGRLLQHRFHYVFHLRCHRVRDLADTTLVDLLARDRPDTRLPIQHAMRRPERLLFVIDGLEEMTFPCDVARRPPCKDWDQRLPVGSLLLHLLRKDLLPEATLLVTARDGEDLRRLCRRPRCLPIPGFSEGDRKEYFSRFFGHRKEARRVWRWVRRHEALCQACAAPLVCWAVGSCLKRQLAWRPAFWLHDQTATSLYAHFFSSVDQMAEESWSLQSRAEQWQALCTLAARGLWASSFTFAKEAVAGGARPRRAPLLRSLLQLHVLREVADCAGCLAFAHPSFQAFLGALFYALRGKEGAVPGGGLSKLQERRAVLAEALVDANPYWRPTALFIFGLSNPDLAGPVEDALHLQVAPRVPDELGRWAEELSGAAGVPCAFELAALFQCLHEAQDEALATRVLGRLLEADLEVGDLQLRAAAFCLPRCQGLRRLRLSARCLLPHTESRRDPSSEIRLVSSKTRQWQDLCSVFHYGNVRELDLSNSQLNATAMRKLCHELRNPRCRLQKLTCKSISPVRVLKELVLLLHGNHRLTHLNLSSNPLGAALSRMVFRTLRHSACRLTHLWLESCGLPSAACRSLALELGPSARLRFLSLGDNDLSLSLSRLRAKSLRRPAGPCALRQLSLEKCSLSAARAEEVASVLFSAQGTSRLCLAFNPLQDAGLHWLCAALRLPGCTLRRLELCSCELGAPSGGHLARALLQNQGLTHLSLRRNRLGDEGVRALSEALSPAACRLQSLDLSECAFGEEGCWVLAEALGRSSGLKVLDVGGNHIGDAGGKRLCATLKRPSCTLNTLGLESCSLTSACCKDLATALGARKSLVHLNLVGNDLGPEGVLTLWAALRKPSCGLQKLGLEKDLGHLVEGQLQELREKGRFLRILCKWDFNELEDKWWW